MKRCGVSLLELVIVSGILSILMMALLALQGFVVKVQQKHFRMRKMTEEVVVSLESIKKSMRSASVIVEPAPLGIASKRLMCYCNVNPSDMYSRVVASAPQTYFLYCFQNTEGILYKYSGSYPPASSFTPFWCGKPASKAQSREIVINGLRNATVEYYFTRDSKNSNAVNVDYHIWAQGDQIRGATGISVQKSL